MWEEEQWLKSDVPKVVMTPLRERRSERKARLFAVSCGYYLWDASADPLSRNLVLTLERFADREVQASEMQAAKAEAGRTLEDARRRPLTVPEHTVLIAMLAINSGYVLGEGPSLPVVVADSCLTAREPETFPKGQDAMVAMCCHFLRDIFGNPFRPAAIAPAWLTSTVVALARGIYDDRVFDRMPILGDALEDAGCDNADILAHCRDANAMHVRGCWVVDLVLGKE